MCGLSNVNYSKTSNNGPSEKRTTSVERTAHLPPVDFTFQTSEKWTPLNSEQRTLISSQCTLANTKLPPKTDSKDNTDACRPLSLRHHHWIQRLSTTVHRASLSCQRKATERFENVRSTFTDYHAYQKHTECL